MAAVIAAPAAVDLVPPGHTVEEVGPGSTEQTVVATFCIETIRAPAGAHDVGSPTELS